MDYHRFLTLTFLAEQTNAGLWLVTNIDRCLEASSVALPTQNSATSYDVCPNTEDFTLETEGSVGYEIPQEALAALPVSKRPSGEPQEALKAGEDTVTWVFLEENRRVGVVIAMQFDSGWMVIGGERCQSE